MSRLSHLKQALEDRLQLASAYKAVFENPGTREDTEIVFRHLMKECGLLKPKIITDPNMLLVRQGQQHIVLSILRILGKDPIEITEQIKESMKYDNE